MRATHSKKQVDLKTAAGIEYQNICDALSPWKEELCLYYLRKGLKSAVGHVLERFGIRIYPHELVEFIDVEYQVNILDKEIGKYKSKVYRFYKKEGLNRLKTYVFHQYGFKLDKEQLRGFLRLEKNPLYLKVKQVRKLSWSVCGFNGSYDPIAADKHMDTNPGQLKNEYIDLDTESSQLMVNQKKVALIAAGLLSPNQRVNTCY